MRSRCQSEERRPGDVGLARLPNTLQELGALDLSLDVLCDELLARLSPSAEDDVALLAVRLDRPRSAGAPGADATALADASARTRVAQRPPESSGP